MLGKDARMQTAQPMLSPCIYWPGRKDARMHGGLGGDMPVCILGIRFFLKKALAWLKIEAEGQMGKEMYR